MVLNARFVEALARARSIGIDVSKATLAVCCLLQETAVTITVTNDRASVLALMASTRSGKESRGTQKCCTA